MALGLLCLGFTLLGALKTQAQDFLPTLLPSPPLSKVPVQPGFREDQSLAVPGDTVHHSYGRQLNGRILNGSGNEINMSSIIYKLEYDHSFISNSTLLRGQVCEQFIRTFVPSVQGGQFTLGNMKRYRGVQSYTMIVAATNYNEFAVVCIKQIVRNREYFQMDLYGRTNVLSPELKKDFVTLAKYFGLTDASIVFTVPMEQCIDD